MSETSCESCESCRFWDSNKKRIFGLCRQSSPAIELTRAQDYYGIWPTTASYDWCGQFELNVPRSLQVEERSEPKEVK